MNTTIVKLIFLILPTTLIAQKFEMGPLCSCVSDRRQDTREDSPYEYEFEERIYKMAGADITKDSFDVINKKVHDLWINNEKRFVCSGTSFNVMRGNILKLAAYTSFSEFLDRAVYDWKVPLNTIDETDGRTTLDYIKDELLKSKDQPKEKALKSYYELLRKAGAKHRSEL